MMHPSILGFILLLLRPLHSMSLPLPSIITKSGCESICGNTTIFYLFGMKHSNCFADEWFQVECRNGTKPYLRKLSLPLVEISVAPSQVRVMSPVHFQNCSGKTNTPPVPANLSGSPFVYSQNDNSFVAVGCNSLALLTSRINNRDHSFGYASICDSSEDETSAESNNCSGRHCCATEILKGLNDYTNISFREIRGVHFKGDMCKYAFIMEDKLRDDNWDVMSLTKKGEDYSPTKMDWGIINQTALPLNSSSILCNSSSQIDDGAVGWRSYCRQGFSGNPYLSDGCVQGDGISNTSHKLPVNWIITGVGSSLAFVSLIIGSWFLGKALRDRRLKTLKQKYFNRNGGVLLQQRSSSGGFLDVDKVKLFSSNDMKKATDNFNVNRVLGKGGQGTVYKGMLSDGKTVAVKQFKLNGNVEEFINEVVILSQINHRYIVELLGCCLETEVPLLVYEFLSYGTLFQHLHEYEENEEIPMTWEMRLRIACEIAGALTYLHSVPIFHRDIKSSNILLDGKFRAKIADFGISRIVSVDQTHLTTQVQGTIGYLDPEYFQTSQFTEKCDVYSFGVILAELLTGQKAVSTVIENSDEGVNLASKLIHAVEENHLFDILDDRVSREAEKQQVDVVANLAKRCLNLHGRLRPTMQEVTMELERFAKEAG